MMNLALILLYAASIAVDGYTTQRTPRFHEADPFAKPFIHSVRGEALGCALGFAVGVLPSYLMRKKHKKLARAWLGTFTAGEAANSARMAEVYAHARR